MSVFLNICYMGFLNNMADEFGKKTGKAIGNKLYGKHADDFRIGVSSTNSGDGGKTTRRDLQIAEMENETRQREIDQKTRQIELQAELEEKGKIRQISNEIAAISFSTSDIEENFTKLDSILPYAKLEAKRDEAKEQLVEIAQTKYMTGLEICRRIDPNHPMLEVFEEQKLAPSKKKRHDDDDDDMPQALSASQIRNLNKIEFSSTDIDANIKILNNLLIYFELDPDRFEDKEITAIKMAQSKFKSGLAMCKSISPNHPMIDYLQNEMTEKIEQLKQEKLEEDKKSKKSSRNLTLIMVGCFVVFVLCMLLAD